MTDDQPGTGATLEFDLLQDGQVQVCVLADNHRELPLRLEGSLHETYLLLRALKTAIDEELDGKLTTLHTKFGNVVRFTRESLETLHRKCTALTDPPQHPGQIGLTNPISSRNEAMIWTQQVLPETNPPPGPHHHHRRRP